MPQVPTIKLNDGHEIPQLGFGVFQVPPQDTAEVVTRALRTGYRHIDTAAAYGNEAGVGQAVHAAGLDRKDVYITTKCFNDDHGFEQAKRALRASLDQLEMDFVDLYLIHWPVPSRDRYVACSTSTCAPRRCRRSQHSTQASGRARTPTRSFARSGRRHERREADLGAAFGDSRLSRRRLRGAFRLGFLAVSAAWIERTVELWRDRVDRYGSAHARLRRQAQGMWCVGSGGRSGPIATILSRSAWVGGTRCRVGGACAASLNASLMSSATGSIAQTESCGCVSGQFAPRFGAGSG